MGGQAYVVVAVGWRSLLFSLKHSILHCCEILSSWRVGAYPAGGRTFGRLYPSGRIAVVRLTFSCVLSVCVFFSPSSVSCFAWLRSFVSRRGVLGFLCETQGRPPDVRLGTCGAQSSGFALRLCFVALVILCWVFFRFFSSPSLPHSLGFAQDSPWLSWSNSVEVAFWFAVAQANAGGCFFWPCSFVLLFLYFFLAKVTAVFLLFFGPGFIVEV